VIATQKEIAKLESQMKEPPRPGGDGTIKDEIANPTYESFRLKLVDAQTAVQGAAAAAGPDQCRLQRHENCERRNSRQSMPRRRMSIAIMKVIQKNHDALMQRS